MKRRAGSFLLGFRGNAKGAVIVEFALVSTIFLVLVAGIVDFGHALYMRQVITNSSREGARYGVTYRADAATGARLAPSSLSPTIKDYVLTKYLASATLPADAHPTVTMAGTGYATGTKGNPLEVTVSATKNWWLISGFIPGMGNQITLSATTVMQCE